MGEKPETTHDATETDLAMTELGNRATSEERREAILEAFKKAKELVDYCSENKIGPFNALDSNGEKELSWDHKTN